MHTLPDEALQRFTQWMADAERQEANDPNAMALATASADGRPSVRMVLLKDADARGFVFYTNLESQKGLELTANPYAALCFHWKSLRRQVRIEGKVEAVTTIEADTYFASRPRASQIGAWASQQSRPLAGRFDLEKAVAGFTGRFGIAPVPRPPHWSGFRLVADHVEFWQDKPFRLHERATFTWNGTTWTTAFLFP